MRVSFQFGISCKFQGSQCVQGALAPIDHGGQVTGAILVIYVPGGPLAPWSIDLLGTKVSQSSSSLVFKVC